MSEAPQPQEKKKKGFNPAGFVFLVLIVMGAAVFLPTTILLLVGMLPTIVAAYIDRSRRKAKAITVGAMNFAGATPFLFQLWTHGQSYHRSIELILDPMTITVIYIAAATGYVLDWGMCGIVSSFLHQKGLVQQKITKEKQKELVERWGREVTGDFALDESGFARQREDKKLS